MAAPGYSLQTQNTHQMMTANPFANVSPVATSFGSFNVGKGSASGGASADARGSASAGGGSVPSWVWIAAAGLGAVYLLRGGKRG
jgi:hypothetical protein